MIFKSKQTYLLSVHFLSKPYGIQDCYLIMQNPAIRYLYNFTYIEAYYTDLSILLLRIFAS
jgi:hypothetical protein